MAAAPDAAAPHWSEEDSPRTKIRASPPSRNASGNSEGRNCDTARGAGVGRSCAGPAPRLSLGLLCKVLGGSCPGRLEKMPTIKKLREIHLHSDIKFNISYVIIILKCSCRQRKPLNC